MAGTPKDVVLTQDVEGHDNEEHQLYASSQLRVMNLTDGKVVVSSANGTAVTLEDNWFETLTYWPDS